MTRSHAGKAQFVFAAVYFVLRYYAAFTLMTYGFAKMMGAQFTILDSQLVRPMGDVSGFWLTWYYFGYSPLYSTVIACSQIGGAVLLCFRKTALLGALILLPVVVNIVCVDVWIIGFRLDSGALRNALYVLLALLGVLAFHARDLFVLLFRQHNRLPALSRYGAWMVGLQVIAVAAMLGYNAHYAYWVANVNNRAPTPIDGAWRVTGVQPPSSAMPDWIYFEYNRAFWVEFHFVEGRWETHDFRVDAKTHMLNIGRQWLTPGTDIFHGTWSRTGDQMILRGIWKSGPQVNLELTRKPMPVKDHE